MTLEGTDDVFVHVIIYAQDIVKALELFNNQNSNLIDGWIESGFNCPPSACNREKTENFWFTYTEGCNIFP